MRSAERRPSGGNGNWRWRGVALALWLACPAVSAGAAEVYDTLTLALELQHEAARTQTRIDAFAAELAALLEGRRLSDPRVVDARARLAEQSALRVRLAADVATQTQTLAELQRLEQEVFPLLIDMADSLLRFVELDLPFAHEQRLERARALRDQLGQADTNLTEHYLALIDAWRRENNYNRTIELHHERTADGQRRLLRIGRIALYRLRGEAAESWQRGNGTWQPLNTADADAVRRAATQVENGAAAWAQLPVAVALTGRQQDTP